ncbi:MAG: SH3 domain-containing protein [Chloroflexota bacterium]|nr:SH3 domain-containing protein [Chloroflexota bacterium]
MWHDDESLTGGTMMRRWCSLLGLTLALALAACGGGGSSSPAADAAATTTRSAEQTQVSSVLTPAAASGSAVARGTTSAGSPPSGVLIPAPQGTRAPTAVIGSPPAPVGTSPAPASSSTAPSATAPSSAATQVVKVTADDGANVRDKPDTSGQVIGKLDYGAEAPVLDPSVTGADGTSKWVRVSFEGKTGFIRSDLITGPQAPSPPRPPTAVASPGPAPTATAKP